MSEEAPSIIVSPVPEPFSRQGRGFDFIMGAETIVGIGLQPGAEGLTEAHGEWRRHHIDASEKLMNLSGIGTPDGKPVNKDAPRTPYVKQDFPTMVRKPGIEKVVKDKAELQRHLDSGWRQQPYPPKPQIEVLDAAAEKNILKTELAASQAQVISLHDALNKRDAAFNDLQAQVADFMAEVRAERVAEPEAKKGK